MERDNIVEFPAPHELTEGQRNHWEDVLINSERAYQYALRMLGRISIGDEQKPPNNIT